MERICVFCGEKMGMFSAFGLTCAGIYQPCCSKCLKELKDLDEAELCRRALRLGYAIEPAALDARIEQLKRAEEHRPKCLRCGGKLRFEPVQHFDNSPHRDSVFSEGFRVLPAYCPACGKYEFYKPSVAEQNPYIACLIENDQAK